MAPCPKTEAYYNTQPDVATELSKGTHRAEAPTQSNRGEMILDTKSLPKKTPGTFSVPLSVVPPDHDTIEGLQGPDQRRSALPLKLGSDLGKVKIAKPDPLYLFSTHDSQDHRQPNEDDEACPAFINYQDSPSKKDSR